MHALKEKNKIAIGLFLTFSVRDCLRSIVTLPEGVKAIMVAIAQDGTCYCTFNI